MFSSSRSAAIQFRHSVLRAAYAPPVVCCPTLHQVSVGAANCKASASLYQLVRHGSSMRFTRNMEFFAADDAPIPKIKNSLCVASPSHPSTERPLTLLMCWLMSKDSHVKKFIKLYNDWGFDVLKLRISPFDLLRPTKGSQVVASQMLDFLHQNPRHSQVLVHGFSVGAYLFSEGLVQIANDMDRHGPLMDRMVGQIWDSVVDVYGIPDGISKAVTNNKLLQLSIKKYLEWFLQNSSSTIHYHRSSEIMHDCFLNRPGLFLLSKTDPVSTPQMNAVAYEKWEKKGLPVFVKIFDDSPHVSHYHRHREAYELELLSFLRKVGFAEGDKKRRAA